MKKIKLILFITFLFTSGLFAQNDSETLITIAGNNVSKADFLSIYQKNNIKNEKANEQNIKDYLELFINYKIKVKEAESLGLDTSKSFKSELAGYRRQLAKPYLSNREVSEVLLKEAYERMKTDIHASHILIKLSENASPKDTLAAYNKITKIRKEILGGMDFSTAAKKYSDDESAKDKIVDGKIQRHGNGGDLGYFSVLNMIYEFENAAYNTKIGEISNPVRSQFGYHIIKVHNKKPALGKIQVAHILTIENDDNKQIAKEKIDAAHKDILNGEAFENVVSKYSEDKGSAQKGGILPEFGSFRMATEFIEPIYDMKVGEISAPIKTSYGWHIVKLISKKGIPSYDEINSDLKIKVGRDSRSFKAKDILVQKLKKEYNFTFNNKAFKTLLPFVNDSIYTAMWKISHDKKLDATICKIATKEYSIYEFAQYMANKQSLIKKDDDKATFMNFIFNQFAEDKILEYENGQLETKYPEFRALLNEYRDGILLFNLMDSKVWSKAIKDTIGIKEYYKTIEKNYMYGNRVEAAIYTYDKADLEKVLDKAIAKAIKKGTNPENILKKINTDSIPQVKYINSTIEKGNNEFVDKTEWTKNAIGKFTKDSSNVIVWIIKTIDPEPKPLQAVKGSVTAEYQNYLEKEWMNELRAKYQWTVNENALKSLYSK